MDSATPSLTKTKDEFIKRVHDALTSDEYECPTCGDGVIQAWFRAFGEEDVWDVSRICQNGCDYSTTEYWLKLTAAQMERLRLWQKLFPTLAYHHKGG